MRVAGGGAAWAGHKANYRCPRGIQTVEHDPQNQIKQLAMPAGSVMFFADGALVHGTCMRWPMANQPLYHTNRL